MATIREIRRRIKSVQSTAKITKAMEMIAASKMRRAQERDLAGRPYADLMRQVLGDLAAQRQASMPMSIARRRASSWSKASRRPLSPWVGRGGIS